MTVVIFIRQLIHDLEAIPNRSPFLRNNLNSLFWSNPTLGEFKIYCDASDFYEKKAGFGCALRDHEGQWIKGCSRSFPPWSVMRCEILALWRGLVLSWECGIKRVNLL
ncbi:hypothetical protein PIB30_056432 [Stylosanthes scabra]|uniref:RNase H type-1 domain-containing protein n=1 Tax=Stylosanthes scabra TaxID=79078 RepID=A0ABU6SJ98_9FABA|nr:hypothetical protein [Stylosanthes scabra]